MSLSGAQIDGHLVLVGLPGAGKSTIGRVVAKRLGRPFLDFDVEIERRVGRSVSRFFAEQGESVFRELEVSLTQELAAAPPMVLAPGGGWITNAGVIDLLRPPGRIVHLRVSPEEAMRRIARSRIIRPLLQHADPPARMRQLWEARSALYNRADLVVNVEVLTSQQVTDSVVALAHEGTPRIG
ncbi:shikimate kinase [Gemmatimonas sp.]|jgi:shikimate kinase|uniref:shikimate kinase n=1 Tax=Gemmatimonas sp. TaxID=1962908 RepID=UPI0037BEE357